MKKMVSSGLCARTSPWQSNFKSRTEALEERGSEGGGTRVYVFAAPPTNTYRYQEDVALGGKFEPLMQGARVDRMRTSSSMLRTPVPPFPDHKHVRHRNDPNI